MRTYFVLPERIVSAKGVTNEETLFKEKTMQIGIGKEETAHFRRGAWMLLDFGREIVGGVRILSYFSENNVNVRLRFGESVSEACSEIGEKNATNDHALRDFVVALPQLSDGVYGETGFRFLRIDAEGPLDLKAVVAVDKRCDLPVKGSFSCNDARVNEIFSVAKETVLCCVQNGFIWDGVKRDRLVWIGDLHPELLGLSCLTDDLTAVKNCLRLAVEQTPLPGWMNGIPIYSMWWLIDLHDYYAQTGDLAFVREMEAYFCAVLGQVIKYVDEEGRTHFPYDFLDWPTHGRDDEIAGQAGVLALAMRKAAYLSRVLGKETPAEAILSRLKRHDLRVKENKQALAMRLVGGLVPAEETALLERDGSRGISTFMSYYILSALARGGRGEQALRFMREYYGGMLDAGARTFWEDFSLDWTKGSGRIDDFPRAGEKDIHGDFGDHCYKGFRHSLCHGWSCGPIPFLMHTVLGVRVLEAGCKKLALVPDLCGLSHAEGRYPTPMGDVVISHEMRGGKIQTQIEAPEGVEIVESGGSLLG